MPSDLPALVLESAPATPRVVFLHGVCGHAGAYLATFPRAGAGAGGVLAVQGDRPCPGQPRYRTYSWDPERLHARILAAMAASGAPASWGGATLVGYSQGATLAEQLVATHRERYARVVLVGSPRDPAPARLARAAAVATVSCAHDVPRRMSEAASRLRSRGVPARYFEMPGCTHGAMGDGERVFGNIFEFLMN